MWKVFGVSAFFHITMPLYPIVWHNFITFSTGLMIASFRNLQKSDLVSLSISLFIC